MTRTILPRITSERNRQQQRRHGVAQTAQLTQFEHELTPARCRAIAAAMGWDYGNLSRQQLAILLITLKADVVGQCEILPGGGGVRFSQQPRAVR